MDTQGWYLCTITAQPVSKTQNNPQLGMIQEGKKGGHNVCILSSLPFLFPFLLLVSLVTLALDYE